MKRTLSILLALVLMISCVGFAAAEELKGELTVSLRSIWTADDESGKAMADAVAAYEAAHPGVKITLQGASQQDIKESFQTAALAGGGPDVVTMDNSGHAIDLAAMGLLLPLNNFVTDEELEATYQQGPLNSGKFEGVYYSLPWFMDCCGLYYNQDRLDECGLKPPTTWEELENCIKVLKEKGYGGLTTYKSAYAFYSFFYQNNCSVIDTTGEIPVVTIDDANGVEAWNYICRLINDYDAVVEGFKEATSWDKTYESFVNGECTFLLGGDWCRNGINKLQPSFKYGISSMVKGKTQATILGGWTWNINVNTKVPELAYDFVKYLSSAACDGILLPKGQNAARKDFDFETALVGKEELRPLSDQFGYTMARPAIINEKVMDELITNAVLTVIYKQATPEEALTKLAADMRANIAENYGE